MGKKIGRNDPCPCGSGKKYKLCCINKMSEKEIQALYLQQFELAKGLNEANKCHKILDIGKRIIEHQKNSICATGTYVNMALAKRVLFLLNHNQLVEVGYQDDISFYTKQVYLQLQKKYPEYGITDEEIASVAHLAPIHDIGKIKVPIEILNKNGKLTDEEMNVVKQHPLVGAAMTQRFPEGITTEKLNKYSYEICRHHHERYDGSGYPDGLKGNAIPMCAQVVGIVDAYDALINDRPYKRKYEPEEAIRMISNGECGAFSKKLIQCLTAAAKQPEWLKVTKSQA